MKQDIADRLEILEGQRAEAKQLRKQARRAHRNNEAELLTKYISFTNYCIYECYKEDADVLAPLFPDRGCILS
ncbi:hypothetical protein [Escherichia coli]|uniref:hypothetical protein n=1 Tax=Escherichia coli TaxID=562 RepID=UPI001FF18C78|nr:hypothetical protein [Escherichia coli]